MSSIDIPEVVDIPGADEEIIKKQSINFSAYDITIGLRFHF
jgi:hypothetical protein